MQTLPPVCTQGLGRVVGVAVEKEGDVPGWGPVLRGVLRHLWKHLLRILGLMLIMVMAMSMLGMMPGDHGAD
jgi:hypothetical protein